MSTDNVCNITFFVIFDPYKNQLELSLASVAVKITENPWYGFRKKNITG